MSFREAYDEMRIATITLALFVGSLLAIMCGASLFGTLCFGMLAAAAAIIFTPSAKELHDEVEERRPIIIEQKPVEHEMIFCTVEEFLERNSK